MKKIKKIIALSVLTTAVVGSSTVLAATNKGEFTFQFVSNVIGTTDFKLANKATTCNSTADTWQYNQDYTLETKCHYSINLEGSGMFDTDYNGSYQLADGKNRTTNFGTIKKNTYSVNIGSNDDMAPYGQEIRGKGTIYQ